MAVSAYTTLSKFDGDMVEGRSSREQMELTLRLITLRHQWRFQLAPHYVSLMVMVEVRSSREPIDLTL